MKPVLIVAINTYREIIRDRILYGIVVFAFLLIGLSLALGQLSFSEQMRITTSFGLSAIQISAVVLSIFLGSTLVTREIEKKTILTLLVRPVTRFQFLIGKAMGLLMVQLVVITGLAGVLLLVYKLTHVPIHVQVLIALYGVFLEATVLLGVALFFSIFAAPMMVVAFSVSVFLVGHWLDSLKFFTSQRFDLYHSVGVAVGRVLPNLQNFNWRSAVIYADIIPSSAIGWSSLYGVLWFLALIAAAALLFWGRDFG